MGGGSSQINGSLYANGQVYLINQNGIVVGPSGVINAAGFTGSTRDITDPNFLKGRLKFTGRSAGSVVTLGKIKSTLGDVVLIGKTVNNQGKIVSSATAGLIASDSVLLGQKNADGSTISVSPIRLGSLSPSGIGVKNSGSIQAASAELKAANGNIYSLAIQNSGTIRATSSKKQGGHIWLTSGSGTIENTGTLNASATAAGGKGGSVVIKNAKGTTIDSGKVVAQGGTGGSGGSAEVSGNFLQYLGSVSLTAPGGQTGTLLFDPENVTIQTASGSPLVPLSGGSFTTVADNSIITVSSLETALATANITVSTGTAGSQSGDITVANSLTWSSSDSLTLSAANNIYLNANITAKNGGLVLNAGNAIATGNETSSGTIKAAINLSSFSLVNGLWVQDATVLPAFNASTNFSVVPYPSNTNSFLRVTGGNGSTATPYKIGDVYGLQGIALVEPIFATDSFVLTNNINASGTAKWNSGAGFFPITNLGGVFNGAGFTISGLTINRPNLELVGLFGAIGYQSTVENLVLNGGSVSGSGFVGGLAGNSQGIVNSVSSSINVTGASNVGGLIGDVTYGTLSNCSSSGSVTGPSTSTSVGGLVGLMSGTTQNSYATGSVTGGTNVGGLIGEVDPEEDGPINNVSNCYATGAVTGQQNVGGLVGLETSEGITGSYATGTFSGENSGGLIGESLGTFVIDCYATGSESGFSSGGGGGLIGQLNGGTVDESYASGSISALYGGGLVGYLNNGNVTTSFASGSITAIYGGGLVGYQNSGNVLGSFATGAVSAVYGGGLIGDNTGGNVSTCFATGQVTGTGSSIPSAIGGLIGSNSGTVANCYSTGSVSSAGYPVYIGGLVGYSPTGHVDYCYSTGKVPFYPYLPYSGGLIGDASAALSSYWAQDTNLNQYLGGLGNSQAVINNAGATPESLANLKLQSTFAGFDFTNVWTTNNNTSEPVLKGVSLNISGTTAGASDAVDFISGGAIDYTTAAASGTYNFYLPANLATAGTLVTDATGHAANAYYVSKFVPSTTPITLNLTPNTLSVQGTGTLSNAALSAPIVNLGGSGINYFAPSGSELVTNSGVSLSINAPYILDSNITAAGNINTSAAGSLSGTTPVTLSATNLTLLGSITDTAQITFNVTGSIKPSGPISVGRFILENGNWQQIVGQNGLTALPTFTDSGDFELQNASSFMRAAGGKGTTTSPYQITDVYGLQGIGSPSNAYLADSYVMEGSIDASGATLWNSGEGFKPIGNTQTASFFSGTFNGNGYSINDLTINQPNGNDIGLFSEAVTGATFENLNFAGGAIMGSQYVGSLAGYSNATTENCSTSASINASGISIGGLLGLNGGTVSGCHSTGAINCVGGYFIGGLVGDNQGIVENSYSTGNTSVSINAQYSAFSVGGLVGSNESVGIIKDSYASGNILASTNVGGLVGANSGQIQQCYASGSVTGTNVGTEGGLDGYKVGGLVGSSFTGTIQNCYSTGNVTADFETAGGLVGYNDGAIITCYSTGAVNSYNGGLVGYEGNSGSVTACYFAQDTNLNVGDPGIGYPTSNVGVTAETLANLKIVGTFAPSGSSSGQWNFTPGKGVWGIQGYTSTGLINNGMPYFQWQYPTVQLAATNQAVTFGSSANLVATAGTTFSVAGTSSSSLPTYISGSPVLSVKGSNINVGQTNVLGITATPNVGYAVEYATGIESFTPKLVTVDATNLSPITFGKTPAFSDTVSGLVSGTALGGTITFSIGDGKSAGGFYNAGTYTYAPVVAGNNADYVVSTAAGSFTINPATLTYTANAATGTAGQMLPILSGKVSGFLTGENQGDATVGTLSWVTPATISSSAGTYSIDGSGLTAPNYIFVQAPANATALTLK